MDDIIDTVGNQFCSILNSLGGERLGNVIGCGYDNYTIGIFVLIFGILLIFGVRGFFFFGHS